MYLSTLLGMRACAARSLLMGGTIVTLSFGVEWSSAEYSFEYNTQNTLASYNLFGQFSIRGSRLQSVNIFLQSIRQSSHILRCWFSFYYAQGAIILRGTVLSDLFVHPSPDQSFMIFCCFAQSHLTSGIPPFSMFTILYVFFSIYVTRLNEVVVVKSALFSPFVHFVLCFFLVFCLFVLLCILNFT